MKNSLSQRLFANLAFLFLIGFQSIVMAGDFNQCESPRKQVCTREFRPVCGVVLKEERRVDFSNSCTACSNANVDGWFEGRCEQNENAKREKDDHISSKKPPETITCKDPRPEICTLDYNPVCGLDVEGNKKIYANGCNACSSSDVISYGESEDECK